jgi:hypothetical protein
LDALALESGTDDEKIASLTRKGFFEPLPGPWKIGVEERGMGARNYAVLDRFWDLVVETSDYSTANLIVTAVNVMRETKSVSS